MKFYQIPVIFFDKLFWFHSIFGILLTKNKPKNLPKIELTNSIDKQYQVVINPFKAKVLDVKNRNVKISFLSKIYGKLMVFACKYSFFGARVLAKIPFVKYPTTEIAIKAFQKLYPTNLEQRTLCLPRMLFVIATSKTFKNKGVGFIGVFLPSRKMHAWIIENNSNPDPYDDTWICYQPVVAITKKP